MEILLLQDINGIGKKNDLLVVGDGFALNHLLPRRAALVATPLVRKHYAEQIRHRAEERERERQARMGATQAVAGKTVTFTRKATKTGKLYGALNETAIVEALKVQCGITLSTDAIQMDDPIKATGSFSIRVKMGDQSVRLTVVVQPETAKVGTKRVV